MLESGLIVRLPSPPTVTSTTRVLVRLQRREVFTPSTLLLGGDDGGCTSNWFVRFFSTGSRRRKEDGRRCVTTRRVGVELPSDPLRLNLKDRRDSKVDNVFPLGPPLTLFTTHG